MFNLLKSFFSSFSNIFITILILALVFCFILFYYYKQSSEKLERDLKTLESSIGQLSSSVEKQNNDLIKYKKDISEQYDNIILLNKKSKEYDSKINDLTDTIRKHDLEKIAQKKPKMLEKIINNAMEKEIKEIKEITKNE